MKKAMLFLSLLLVVSLLFSFNFQSSTKNQSINPILGDISFVHTYGHPPDATISEDLRIKTHLSYVEHLLRQKEMFHLSSAMLQKRMHLLDLLHDYWTKGVFPRNYDYKDSRKPCFIDKDGRICAVGYLIEQTAGRQTAEQINRSYKYDRIMDMHDQLVDTWIQQSGLTKEECAMIQPSYRPIYEPRSRVTPALGISSGVLGGTNLALNTINSIRLAKGANNKTAVKAGLITGAGQTILGVVMFPKRPYGFYYNTEQRKALSIINMGLGTATMLLSAWTLSTLKKPKELKTTWNLNSFQTVNNNIGVAFTLKRKL